MEPCDAVKLVYQSVLGGGHLITDPARSLERLAEEYAAVPQTVGPLYEALGNGAGKMQQMRYVVIPSILSTVVIMLIMKIGSLLNVSYEKIFLFSTSGGAEAAPMANYQSAYVVSVWANSQTNTVAAMAGEMTNNLIGMILVIGANIVSRKATDVSLY